MIEHLRNLESAVNKEFDELIFCWKQFGETSLQAERIVGVQCAKNILHKKISELISQLNSSK